MPTEPNYELLREAYAIIGGIPTHLFDLEEIVKKRGESLECGTIACAAGWLGMHPKFQALGMSLNEYGGLSLHGSHHLMDIVLGEIFGLQRDDTSDLFCGRGYGRYDAGISDRLSDKKAWMERVRMFLKERGQLTSQLQAKAAS